MLDRFEDIKAMCDKNEVSSAHRLLGDYDLEEGKGAKDTEDRELIKDFLPKTRDLITLIKKMESSNNTIKELKEQQIQEARGDKEKAASDIIQKIIVDTQQCQQQINASLTDMSESVDKAKEEFSKDPECRVMASIHSTLLLKFREVLLSFQQSQTDYKTAVQSKIKRQIAIVKPEAPEEEINELAKDPEAASKLLSDQISGKVHRKLQNAVDDIQNLNTLIQTQGEMLNTIEANLEEAVEYVEKAEKKLILAKKWHQQTRYKMACILVCVLIIGIVLMVIFLK